ncbi:MAG TPA: TonB-dependent receptor, partial [Salinivirgaceae bacterium]|nr:TonB-dependent receptor [Salinivirgaceae bacterium]
KAILTIATFCLLALSVHSQTTIQGTIRDENNNVVAYASVVLMRASDSAVVAFTMSNDDGKYKVVYDGDSPELLLSVHSFDVKRQIQKIENRSQTVDFKVESQKLLLQEVKVVAEKISAGNDTVDYFVSSFANESDKTINDVIRKMPGLKIEADGQITYNGKWVKDLYIEGMDMLQGNYGIAVNNIRAEDVASVQILENHQAVKALQGKERGTSPAINLKLRDAAKGTWSSNLSAQAGGVPFAWNGDINLMFFSQKNQNISYYKTNNIGKDIGIELISDGQREGGTLSLRLPTPPGIDKSYHYLNRSHATTVNHLRQLSKDKQINVNINYFNDTENRENTDFSKYYISGDSSLTIQESLSSKLSTNNLNASVNYKDNNERFFLQNTLATALSFNNGMGNIQNNTGLTEQTLDRNAFRLQNAFSYQRSRGKGSYRIKSRFSLYSEPYDLCISDGSDTLLSQYYKDEGMKMLNSLTLFSTTVNYLKINVDGNLNGSYTQINTRLDRQQDEAVNNISDFRPEVLLNPYLIFFINRFEAVLSFPFGLKGIMHDNKSADGKQNVAYFSILPSLNIETKLGDYFSLTTYYAFHRNHLQSEYMLPDIYYLNYRTAYLGYPHIGKSDRHSASIMLSFKDVFKMLFGSLNVSYVSSTSNTTDDYRYENYLTTITRLPIGVRNEGAQADMSIGKGFYTWNTSLALQAITGIQNGNYLVNNQLNRGELNYQSFNFQASFAPVRWLVFLSKSGVSFSENRVDGEKTGKNLVVWHNRTTADLIIAKRFTINLQFDYFHNQQYDRGKDKVFLNAGFEYDIKSVTLTLNVLNIFDTQVYETLLFSGVNSFRHVYSLRHRTMLAGVRFRLF